MLFLIDYENVGNTGMKGSDYLDSGDHVIIFYSEARKNMEMRIMSGQKNCGDCGRSYQSVVIILHMKRACG